MSFLPCLLSFFTLFNNLFFPEGNKMGRAEGDREIEPIMERPSLVLSVSLPPRPATPPKSFFQYKVASPGPQSLSTVQSNHRRGSYAEQPFSQVPGPFWQRALLTRLLTCGAQACVGREGQKMERTFESPLGERWFIS